MKDQNEHVHEWKKAVAFGPTITWYCACGVVIEGETPPQLEN